MKERPIIFNSEMVRAILDGRKTQTRRVVKQMRGLQSTWLTMEKLIGFVKSGKMVNGGWQMYHPEGGPYGWIRCPYGQPGDLLYVRETWMRCPDLDLPDGIKYRADKLLIWYHNNTDDSSEAFRKLRESELPRDGKWRPSIHMPKWAARIWLKVKDIRVERVQDVAYKDCVSEGIPGPATDDGLLLTGAMIKGEFSNLWNSINEKRGYGWDVNPWVWVVEFERIEKE